MDLRTEVLKIKQDMASGLSYDDAKNKLQPILDLVNIKGGKIAKKHKKRFKKLTFGYVIR